mmetsp:Transcript_10598/g.33571  ORF Transcript_10598/g.33571 Transcript_10598/m.33571 type:complete len:212 (+) Transcript_10598:557-1192(+)
MSVRSGVCGRATPRPVTATLSSSIACTRASAASRTSVSGRKARHDVRRKAPVTRAARSLLPSAAAAVAPDSAGPTRRPKWRVTTSMSVWRSSLAADTIAWSAAYFVYSNGSASTMDHGKGWRESKSGCAASSGSEGRSVGTSPFALASVALADDEVARRWRSADDATIILETDRARRAAAYTARAPSTATRTDEYNGSIDARAKGADGLAR